MSAKKRVQCEPCGGWVTSPNRKITLETSLANHQQVCPAIIRIKEKK